MTNAEYGRRLAQQDGPATAEQLDRAARILASQPKDEAAAHSP